MSSKNWSVFIVEVFGAVLGAGVGFLVGKSLLAAVIGAGIGMLAMGLFMVLPADIWLALAEGAQFIECCSMIGVFLFTGITLLGSFLLWHSFAVAALLGVVVMTAQLLAVGMFARSYGSSPGENRAIQG